MASYGRGDLSLPSDVVGSPNVKDVVSSGARVLFVLEDIRQRMLRSSHSLAEVRNGQPPIVPYMDKVVASSRPRHIQFVKIIHQRGLIRFLTYRNEEVACFFVRMGVFVSSWTPAE